VLPANFRKDKNEDRILSVVVCDALLANLGEVNGNQA
jgi:hypothetical protein